MGKGKRTDFSKLKNNICDKFYDIPSDFNNKKLGVSFGISREHYKKVYLENSAPIDQMNPGPGKYNTRQELGKDAPKYSLFSKLDNNKSLNERNKLTPGPGTYRPISIKSDGRYPISQMKNTSSLGFSKEKRFIDKSKIRY